MIFKLQIVYLIFIVKLLTKLNIQLQFMSDNDRLSKDYTGSLLRQNGFQTFYINAAFIKTTHPMRRAAISIKHKSVEKLRVSQVVTCLSNIKSLRNVDMKPFGPSTCPLTTLEGIITAFLYKEIGPLQVFELG